MTGTTYNEVLVGNLLFLIEYYGDENHNHNLLRISIWNIINATK